jgi:hypothetical protein
MFDDAFFDLEYFDTEYWNDEEGAPPVPPDPGPTFESGNSVRLVIGII